MVLAPILFISALQMDLFPVAYALLNKSWPSTELVDGQLLFN